MTADIQVIKGLERKLTFTVKKGDVDTQVKQELKKYAKKAKVSGFRPGKVPTNVLEQMYGSQAYQDSLGTQLEKTFGDLVTENKLALAGHPKFDLTSSEGEEFIFAALFEVLPEIHLGDLSAITIEKPVYELTDEQIEQTLLTLRKQKSTYIDTDKPAENNDKVIIDFVGTIDGEKFDGGSATGYSFILGNQQMLPEFESGILGLSIGESKNVDLTFPENYHAETFRNKHAIFNITLKQIATQVLPELTSDFIKELGVADGTEETLRQEIKTNLQREIKRRLSAILRENALKALKDSSPLEVPNVLVHEEIHHLMENAENNMKQQGYNASQIKLTHDMFADNAKHLVTLRFLVVEFIKINQIAINDDDVRAVITDMAEMYDDAEQYIKWYYTDATRVNNARAVTMEKKVTDTILSLVKSVDKPTSYTELMQKHI